MVEVHSLKQTRGLSLIGDKTSNVNEGQVKLLVHKTLFLFFSSPSRQQRATIEEVEGDVCELESKLDKVSSGL